MTHHFYSDLSPGHPEARRSRERLTLLLDLSLYRQAIAEVQQRFGWDSDAESLRQLGLIMARFAPGSRDTDCAYRCARVLFRTAMDCVQDTLAHAELLGDIGASYLAEGRLADAEDALRASRRLAVWRHEPHMCLLALACAAGDIVSIQRRLRALPARLPDWEQNRAVVSALVHDRELALLRAVPALLAKYLGRTPEQLRALHDHYCLEALEPALASFDLAEDEWAPSALDITTAVHRTFTSVERFLRGRNNTPIDISPGTLQARIGM